nr:phosphatidylglycerol lysyltransferase domain-containing protein [Leptonema illini]
MALRFRKTGSHVFQSGIEAALDLNDTAWHRSSLRELARRALRYGHIEYFPTSQTDRPYPDLSELRSRSAYANRPALRGLYLTDASQWHKAWSFVVGGQVVGLVTASRRGERAYHTEILMRAQDAPKGTMEALIIRAATDLKQEGAYELSLGECPFVVGDPPDIRIHFYGRMMSHAYHARGLYAFKAKFHPQWRPVFLVSRRRLFLPLVDLFFTTGSARLFFDALFHR